MGWTRGLVLLLAALLLTGASKVPSAYEGRRETYVNEGKQLYPVNLYGIARDWDLACNKGKAAMCLRLAEAFMVGEGDLNADPRITIGYFILACEKGSGRGCAEAAAMARDGSAYPPVPTISHRYAQRGCEILKDQRSCAGLALHLYRGDVGTADPARAIAMWDAACAAKADDGCRLKAGALFFESSDPAKHSDAVALYRAGCDAKQGWGCSGLADALIQGRGTARDDRAAFTAGRKGCLESAGDTIRACAIYARLLARSTNAADIDQASALLTRACLARIGEACNDAGLLGKSNPAGSKLAAWEVPLSFRDGCDLDNGAACGNLGQLYQDGFDNVDRDAAWAVALFDKGCRLGDRASCDRAAAMGAQAASARARKPAIDPSLPARVQLAQAERLAGEGRGGEAYLTVGRLMEESVSEAQWVLGGWFYYGKPGVVSGINQRDGFILMENAARQGHVAALKWVGMAYWYGDGVAEDRATGEGYMLHAANRGDVAAESIWRSMKAEPIRQERARREREMAEAAERRKNDWFSNWMSAVAAWTPSSSGYSAPSSSSSWQSTSSIIQTHNWNNYISYMSGGTTACRSSNPYC